MKILKYYDVIIAYFTIESDAIKIADWIYENIEIVGKKIGLSEFYNCNVSVEHYNTPSEYIAITSDEDNKQLHLDIIAPITV